MNNKLVKLSLGIVLVGALLSFTINKGNNSISYNSLTIAQVNSISEIFVIKNSKSISLTIETIDKIHKFKANEKGNIFRCITTYSADATDFGPYNKLYFLFDNAYEMPHRRAIFKIGNLARINSFKKISNSKYEIKGYMFDNNEFFIEEEVVIIIDASNVINQENKHDIDNSDFEGDMSSKIVVSIESD